jgi:hypothetical protein
MRLELDVEIEGQAFRYTLALELPKGFRELRVFEETLLCDGQPRYTRQHAAVTFSASGAQGAFNVDWHVVALPIVQAADESDPVAIFRRWLARMMILSPTPSRISGTSSTSTLEPERGVENLGDWFTGLIAAEPSAYGSFTEYLTEIFPDFKAIQNPSIGGEAREMRVQFQAEDRSILTLPFAALSDGEKCFFIAATALAAGEVYGPLLCVWDEARRPPGSLGGRTLHDAAPPFRRAAAPVRDELPQPRNNPDVLGRVHVGAPPGQPFRTDTGDAPGRRQRAQRRLDRRPRPRRPASVNKYKDHLLIVPEDDANKDLAVGFQKVVPRGVNAIHIENVAGGWSSARDRLVSLSQTMRRFPSRRVLVLVDYDSCETRREDVLRDVPTDLKDRVYLLGVLSEPELLQRALSHRSREAIGEALARECLDGAHEDWKHPLLAHNAPELARLRAEVLPFLI